VSLGQPRRGRHCRDIAAGEIVRWSDVAVPENAAVLARRDMERRFSAPPAAITAQHGAGS
jgi:hypothetical protein